MSPTTLTLMQTFIAISVMYVWVVRYQAVLNDFTTFQLPDWLRDVTGVCKLTGAVLLLGSDEQMAVVGAGITSFFMLGAVVMHLRVKNPVKKMVPSFGLGATSLFIIWQHLS
jgi:hypothetical protein